MKQVTYISPHDQNKIDEARRRAAAAALAVHTASSSRNRKRSIAFDPTISIWTRPGWILQGRIMMTNRWPN